jgi:hypothetical protein
MFEKANDGVPDIRMVSPVAVFEQFPRADKQIAKKTSFREFSNTNVHELITRVHERAGAQPGSRDGSMPLGHWPLGDEVENVGSKKSGNERR